ncbi:tetratricopeptide repeat protein [Candidatus Obscuribacterales bacterium]|nr:tetratricopeptide repeat protein [Candidatus Obscuribacterales bacterium]MBX3135598.1 tetratricopeptide repeat protein [Candidatus Obscuribacterales bacterium]MBX3149073.1 tetratricopeptide repeat protein [Candidatus Obscuribacterales bacterium]
MLSTIEKVIGMEWSDYKAKVKEALEKSKFDVAETTLLQALQWVKDTGGSSERLCLCLDQLAWIYVNIRDLDRAAACYKESLEVKTSILGEQNPIVARACKKLATVVYMQKRYDLAEKYSKDALNIFKTTLGLDNEETQQTLEDLVSLLRKMNRNYEANILHKMGKTASPDSPEQPKVEDVQHGYSTSQTFLRIRVCSNCSLPYDGDFCMRCTEGRILAEQARKNRTPDPEASEQGDAESQKQTGQQLPQQSSDTKLEDAQQQ